MSISREQAHDILMKYMKGEAYIQHSYAVEAIMKGIAKETCARGRRILGSCRFVA